MRIVYLHQYFNTPRMAGSTRSYEIARRLVRAGHEVHMVTTRRDDSAPRGWTRTNEDGIEVHWLGLAYNNRMGFTRRLLAFVAFAASSARYAAGLRGHVIYATSTPLTIVLPALYACWRSGCRMVFEVRDMWPDVPIALGILRNPLLKRIAYRLEMIAYTRAHHIIALAPGMKQDIVRKGIAEDRVTVVPNGCSVDERSPSDANNPPEHELAFTRGRWLLLYAGTIGKANGCDYLVDLALELKRQGDRACILVIGDGAEKATITGRADALGLTNDNITFRDPLPKNQLLPWLRRSDMHLALMRGPPQYLKDAVNNKFFDALATGKPIANNFQGFQSTIAVENQVGIVIDADDPAVAARQLYAALSDTEWTHSVSSRARALASTTFSYDTLAVSIEKALATAAEGRPKP